MKIIPFTYTKILNSINFSKEPILDVLNLSYILIAMLWFTFLNRKNSNHFDFENKSMQSWCIG